MFREKLLSGLIILINDRVQGKIQINLVASVYQQHVHSQGRCCGNREFKEGINRIKKSVLALLETLPTHGQQNGSMMMLWRGWNTRLEPEVTILE